MKKTTYPKLGARHIHRNVAEHILGRPLNDNEVVHHKDGDKHNNHPDNIQIFPSQKEHAAYHAKKKWSKR